MSLLPWICLSPVHHVVGKYKITQYSVTCAMTTIAPKNATKLLINFNGRSINC
jgi:hypothetical protein